MGDHAFHMIGRWWSRLWFRVKRESKIRSKFLCAFKLAIGGSGLEDAAMAGALALFVPSQFEPVVESWDPVGAYQQLVCFDHIVLSDPLYRHQDFPDIIFPTKKRRSF